MNEHKTFSLGSLNAGDYFMYNGSMYCVVDECYLVVNKPFVVCSCVGSKRSFSGGFCLSIYFFERSTRVFLLRSDFGGVEDGKEE